MLNKTSWPFRDCTLSATAIADGDVPPCLWLKGNVTLRGCLSYSWGSLQLAVDSESQEDLLCWHRCCPSHPEYALKALMGSKNFFLQKPCLKAIKPYSVIDNLTSSTQYWHLGFTALGFTDSPLNRFPYWRSTSSMNLILWHLNSHWWHHAGWRRGLYSLI